MPCSKTTHYFSYIFCFFQHTIFAFEKLCFAESTIKIVFSEKRTQLFKNTVSQTHFFTHVKKTPFSKKWCHFWFWAISAETTIFRVFPDLHCFGPKKNFWPKQIVCTKMRVFSPFLTQIVSGNFC